MNNYKLKYEMALKCLKSIINANLPCAIYPCIYPKCNDSLTKRGNTCMLGIAINTIKRFELMESEE